MKNCPPHGRVDYIDYVKGIAIIAVVLFHIQYMYPHTTLFNFQGFFGYLWHVGIFFVISGFFITEDKMFNKLWLLSRLRKLYLPATVIYLLAVVLHNVFIVWGWSDGNCYETKKEFAIEILKILIGFGNESIVGAMWFVYCLIYSSIGFFFVSNIVWRLTNSNVAYDSWRFVVFLIIQLISCVLTNKFGVVSRFANAASVMLLIYVGQMIFQRVKLNFNNSYVAFVCAIILYQGSILMGSGIINLAMNTYNDLLQLNICTISALYICCYMCKRIQHIKGFAVLRIVGQESYYIMCFHFIGFHICTILINAIWGESYSNAVLTTPQLNNIIYVFLYLISGVSFPMLIITAYRYFYEITRNTLKRIFYALAS